MDILLSLVLDFYYVPVSSLLHSSSPVKFTQDSVLFKNLYSGFNTESGHKLFSNH